MDQDSIKRKNLQSALNTTSQNVSNNSEPTEVIDRLSDASQAVCRIELHHNNQIIGMGSGFLIAPTLVLTCLHVIGDAITKLSEIEESGKLRNYEEIIPYLVFRFNYKQSDQEQNQQKVLRTDDGVSGAKKKPIIQFESSQFLDFAVIRLERPPKNSEGLLVRPLSLQESNLQLTTGDTVRIMQHPAGRESQLTRGEVSKVDADSVFYKVFTEGGSSGSPVFDAAGRVPVAVHQAGIEPDNPELGNKGIPLPLILPELKELDEIFDHTTWPSEETKFFERRIREAEENPETILISQTKLEEGYNLFVQNNVVFIYGNGRQFLDNQKRLFDDQKRRSDAQEKLLLRRRNIAAVASIVGLLAILAVIIVSPLAIGGNARADINATNAANNNATAIIRGTSESNAKLTAGAENIAKLTAQAAKLTAQADEQKQRSIASSRELAKSAEQQLSIDPELALAVAVKAGETSETSEAEAALRQILNEPYVYYVLKSPFNSLVAGLSYRVSPNGQYLLLTDLYSELKIYNIKTKQLIRTIFATKREYPFHDIFFSFDGQFIAVQAANQLTEIWNVKNGQQVLSVITLSLIFNPKANQALFVTANTAKIYDFDVGKALEFKGHSAVINKAVFNLEGNFIATASSDKTAKLWEAKTGNLIKNFTQSDAINDVEISPNNKFVLLNHLSLWDIQTGRKIKELVGTYSGTFTPSSEYVVTTDYDTMTRKDYIWETRTGELKTTINDGYTTYGEKSSFSRDSKYTVVSQYAISPSQSSARSNTAKVLEVNTGKLITELVGHTSVLNYAIFSPDGKSILTGSDDVWWGSLSRQ